MFAILASLTAVKAAPVAYTPIPAAVTIDTNTLSALPVHFRGPRHNCRRHGLCGWVPGWGQRGYGRRSCRRVRRRCWRRHGGGRRYRRCTRRRGCLP